MVGCGRPHPLVVPFLICCDFYASHASYGHCIIFPFVSLYRYGYTYRVYDMSGVLKPIVGRF